MADSAIAAHPGRGARPGPAAAAGSLLRSTALGPSVGFPRLFRFSAGPGGRLAHRSAALLTFLGGASGMLLWLKVGGLLGTRSFAAPSFRWSYLAGALLTGAAAGLMARAVWTRLLGRAGSSPERLRLVWGAASVPQTIALFVLLPLDIFINGRFAFVPGRLPSTGETVWAALSIALSLSLLVWSCAIFWVGLRKAAPTPGLGRALAGLISAAGTALGTTSVLMLFLFLLSRTI